ncbi:MULTISPECIES: hypothetical protein [unclassified Streptomyces]
MGVQHGQLGVLPGDLGVPAVPSGDEPFGLDEGLGEGTELTLVWFVCWCG